MYFSPAQNTWIHRNKVTILHIDEYETEATYKFVWPRWAVDEANKLVNEGMALRVACDFVYKKILLKVTETSAIEER